MFRKDIEPMCVYCEHCNESENETFTCVRKSREVEPDSHCRRFKYDPLRRVPVAPAPLVGSKFSEKDFLI